MTVSRLVRAPVLVLTLLVALLPVQLFPARASASSSTNRPVLRPLSTASSRVVDLDGAHIVLPRGWVARSYARWMPKGLSSYYDFCLSPRNQRVRRGVDTCPLGFTRARHSDVLDPDVEGGFEADPHYCGQTRTTVHAMADTLELGGRSADHAAWSILCRTTDRVHKIIQYVVVTAPAYVLFTDHGGRDVGAAMDYVAAHSQLPARDAPLPLFDRGIVTSVARSAHGVRIRLRRVRTPYGTDLVIKDHSGRRYSYVVPKALWQRAGARARSEVTLQTDGHRVQSIRVDH